MNRHALVQYLDQLLTAKKFTDYCPNGLQVEGSSEIFKIVTGVSASLALIDEAISQQADTILVHHGYFWKGENPSVLGFKKERLKKLLTHNINLIAYHLPLDAHEVFGNNVQLAQHLNFEILGQDETHHLLFYGQTKPQSVADFTDFLTQQLNRAPLVLGKNKSGQIRKIAWCSGAAQNYLNDAAALGVDAFLSGEVSEKTTHEAKELGLYYFAIGHHASERYGIQALAQHLAKEFPVECVFVDLPNPV